MVGGDYDIPVMYQDLANYTMGPMSMPFGGMLGMGYNTSYLGGTQIKPQPDTDQVQIMNKKKAEGYSTAKKVAITLGAIFIAGFIPTLFGKKSVFSKMGKYITKKMPTIKSFCSKSWQAIKNIPSKIKNLFKKKP